jgi:hypothetical protein
LFGILILMEVINLDKVKIFIDILSEISYLIRSEIFGINGNWKVSAGRSGIHYNLPNHDLLSISMKGNGNCLNEAFL